MEYKKFMYADECIEIEVQKKICEKYIENDYNLAKTYKELNIREKLARKIVEMYNIKKKVKRLSDHYEYIINNTDLSSNELSEILGFSSGKIQNVLDAINLNLSSDMVESIINDKKYNKLNNSELSKKYGISDRVLGHYFKINNMLNQSIRKHKNNITASFFKKIDNFEKAYWLGFIFADGSISGNRVTIALSVKDKEVLIKFCNSLNIDHSAIKEYIDNHFGTHMCRISFADSIITEDINKVFDTKNKTYDLHIPNIDEKLFKYFLCGYFDGDGSIAREDGKPCVEFTTHKNNVEWLNFVKKFLDSNGIESHLDLKPRKNSIRLRIWKLSSIENLMNLMYDDSGIKELCLKRKYERFFNRFN